MKKTKCQLTHINLAYRCVEIRYIKKNGGLEPLIWVYPIEQFQSQFKEIPENV